MNPICALISAQSTLACQLPLMAPLVLTLEFAADPTIPTMATAEDCTTYYNPDYVRANSATPGHLESVIYHEALHLFLNYFGRRCGRDNTRWNIAHDLEIASEVQPPNCLVPAHFHLPPDQLAERYYAALPESTTLNAPSSCSHGILDERGGGGAASPSTQRAIIECAVKIVEADGRGSSRGLMNQALKIVSPAAGNDRLRRLQGALLSAGNSDFSYGRHNRRTAGRVGPILPAVIHYDARVMCVLDVSGSMGGRTEIATAALLGAVKSVGTGLDVVAWDTRPQAVCNVRTATDLKKLKFSGGGTDMAAAIRYCVKRGRYDAIFVVTDCETNWPTASEGRKLPPVYILRVGTEGEIPSWMTLIQAD